MSGERTDRLAAVLKKNIWLVFLLAAGLLLLLLPSSSGEKLREEEKITSLEEDRLAGALSKMEGVGEVYVLLAEKPGREEGFSGAVILCSGAGDPSARLRITEAVAAYTGLGSHQIIVEKIEIIGGIR